MSIKIVALNKKALFQYELKEKFEAGLKLLGAEVKSLRKGQCDLKSSYISFVGGEAFLQKAHIKTYKTNSNTNYNPERLRKLLLKKKELHRIQSLTDQKKMSCIPMKIYFKGPWAKVEIAIGIGKTKRDKRQALKKREDQISMERAFKHKKPNRK